MNTKVGIIGCGSISTFHHEGWHRAGAQITHVCDMRLDAAQAVATRYQAKATMDYRVLLADPEVEIVSICTTSSTHVEICLAAIAAGKGIVCEKTLADNPTDAAKIARAAQNAGNFFATAFMKRFFPAAQQAKALLKDMGDIISIHARSWQPWDLWNHPLPENMVQRPSIIRKSYGGGVLVCAGSHILDLLHWISGRPTQVCGRMHSRDGLDIDILTNAMLWFENGAIANFEVCWHPLAFAGYERNGWDERLEINTTKGRLDFYTVLWNRPTNNGALLVHQDAVTGHVTEYRYPALNPFDLEMAEFLKCFLTGSPASPSAWDGYVVDEVIAQIKISAIENRIVSLHWQDRTSP